MRMMTCGLSLILLFAVNGVCPVTAPAQSDGAGANVVIAASVERDQLAEKQRAAIAEARRIMDQPIAPAPDAAGAVNHTARPTGAASRIFLTVFVLIMLAGAGALFYMGRRPLSPDTDGDAGTRAEATSVRAAFDRQDGAISSANANSANPRFLELLVENNLITPDERASLTTRFQGNDFAIMLYLTGQRVQIRNMLGKLWGDSLNLAYTDPTKTIIQTGLVEKLPDGFAKNHGIIPISITDNVVTVAMADPNNTGLQRQIENHLDAIVSPIFALPAQIQSALELAQISLRVLKDQLSEKLAGAAQEGAKIGRLAEEASIAEFVRSLFILALKQHASDIHIEPHDTGVSIRLRIDGALQEYLQIPMRLFPALSNVIKIMAEADIGERRRPQDGRITLKLADRELEFRFSCVPTIYGEKMVLRLLGQNQFASVPSLDDLHFARPILDGIRRIIESPNGVFFVTGPTGSGKTTTLYAVLKALNNKDVNIMTIEDPVEYRLNGVNQVQINPQAGVTFATALRSFLRQDPDVILVGEIRDLETATIASQAALTGHLVLTTIHTNNALQAVTRLIQIGVEPFLVAPSIIGVMAQRLVRRLCDNCKEKYALPPDEIEKYFEWDGKTEVFFHRAKGCERCNFTGYAGRIAIHELFVIDEGTRAFIARNASILEIQKHAAAVGFTSMRYDGFKKILMGMTTLDEVNQVAVAAE